MTEVLLGARPPFVTAFLPTPSAVEDPGPRLGELGLAATPGTLVETAIRAAIATGCGVHLLGIESRSASVFIGATLRAPISRRD